MVSGTAQLQHLQSGNFLDFIGVRKLTSANSRCSGSECSPRTDAVSTGICLIYWHDATLSFTVLFCCLLLQLTLALFPAVTVIAYLSLSILTITFMFCCRFGFVGILSQTAHPHIFKKYLDHDIHISEDTIRRAAEWVVTLVLVILVAFKQIIFLEDIKTSLKFYTCLWFLILTGHFTSNMCLVIIFTIGIFTLPMLYQMYRVPLDNFINSVEQQSNNTIAWLQEKIRTPFRRQ